MEIERLINSLYGLVELQREILTELKAWNLNQPEARPHPTVMDNLVDSVDVKLMLKISNSTLYRLKKSRLIRTVRIGKQDYFNKADIKKIANNFMK